MSLVRTASALKGLTGIKVRNGASVLKTVSAAHVRSAAGALRTVFSSLGASVAPSSVFGRVNSGDAISIQTQQVTASLQGGVGPYTYLWERTSPDAEVWTISNPTSATTRFIADDVDPAESHSATFVCTVTDANGSEATTEEVDAVATNIGSAGMGPLP